MNKMDFFSIMESVQIIAVLFLSIKHILDQVFALVVLQTVQHAIVALFVRLVLLIIIIMKIKLALGLLVLQIQEFIYLLQLMGKSFVFLVGILIVLTVIQEIVMHVLNVTQILF